IARALEYLLPLKQAPRPFMVALSTLGWLLATKAPSAPPKMVIISKGSAFRITPMLPPCTMYTPKMQPIATSQPMMTNMLMPLPQAVWGAAGHGGLRLSYRSHGAGS